MSGKNDAFPQTPPSDSTKQTPPKQQQQISNQAPLGDSTKQTPPKQQQQISNQASPGDSTKQTPLKQQQQISNQASPGDSTKETPSKKKQQTSKPAAKLPGDRGEPHYPSALSKFMLLMWKNFLQQWRHKYQTLLEILLPVLTMSVILVVRSQIEAANKPKTAYFAFRAHDLEFSRYILRGMKQEKLSFAYSPTSPILEDVVRSAVAKYFLDNGYLPKHGRILREAVFTKLKTTAKVRGYDHSSRLKGIYTDESKTQQVLCAFQFDDKLKGDVSMIQITGATTLPDDISVFIRFPHKPRWFSFYGEGEETWKTDKIFPSFTFPGPRMPYSVMGGNEPGYVAEMFIAMEFVICNEIVSRKLGIGRNDFRLFLKRFPHPPFVQDYFRKAMNWLLPLLIMISFSFSAINLVRAVSVEKEMQLKDAMKIMGLPTWLHWTAWFWKQFIFFLISASLVVVILKVKWFENEEGFAYGVILETSWHVLFFYIQLYLTCTIFFCFMLSGLISKASNAALFAGIFWFLTDSPSYTLRSKEEVSVFSQIVGCLFLNSAMSFGVQELLSRESTGGIRWGEFDRTLDKESTRFSFANIVSMIVFDCFLYMLTALYLEQVKPGPFGTPEPWNFFLRPSFWRPTTKGEKGSPTSKKPLKASKKGKQGTPTSETSKSPDSSLGSKQGKQGTPTSETSKSPDSSLQGSKQGKQETPKSGTPKPPSSSPQGNKQYKGKEETPSSVTPSLLGSSPQGSTLGRVIMSLLGKEESPKPEISKSPDFSLQGTKQDKSKQGTPTSEKYKPPDSSPQGSKQDKGVKGIINEVIPKTFPGLNEIPSILEDDKTKPKYNDRVISVYLEHNDDASKNVPKQPDSVAAKESIEVKKTVREDDPVGHNIGVSISNLTKQFKANTVVNNLSMNIYDDQITVLLGHNGAGKSTTISMLTGSLSVTRGSIMLAGYDVVRNARAARAHLGVCPQHNVLFNELTVREHLEFFARLKGFKGKELKEEIDMLIKKLELEDKSDYQSYGLSGGQKRRLQVGIALSGAALVVLLDEPTSGMDPASRRGLWDLLQKEKKGRSMILTTHFMDEADILGDRIAIMAAGTLQCVGSPFFLKNHYGTGYTLVVVKDTGFEAQPLTDLINKHIPGVSVKEDRGTEITYSLRNEYSNIFQKLLYDIEVNSSTLKLKNYGLTTTTLEEVFMAVGSDAKPVKAEKTDGSGDKNFKELVNFLQTHQKTKKKTFPIYQVKATWYKLINTWRRQRLIILLQVLVPILLVNATLLSFLVSMQTKDEIHPRKLSLEEGFIETETLMNYEGDKTDKLGYLASLEYEKNFVSSGVDGMMFTKLGDNVDMDEYVLMRTWDPWVLSQLKHKMLIGATFHDNHAYAWFSNFGYHDVAVSVAAIYAALIRTKFPNAKFDVYNYPLEANYKAGSTQKLMELLTFQLSFGIGTSVSLISAVFVIFYVKENVSKAKLLQKSSGIGPFTLWVSAMVFDWIWFTAICVLIVISCALFNLECLHTEEQLLTMFVCMMLYGLSMLPQSYVSSYMFNGPAAGFVAMFFMNLIFGVIGSKTVETLQSPQFTSKAAGTVIDNILQFYPLYALVSCIRHITETGMAQWACKQSCGLVAVILPNATQCTLKELCQMNKKCCFNDHPYMYWEKPGIMRYVSCICISGAFLWLLLVILETKFFEKIFHRTKHPPAIDATKQDNDVLEEIKLVESVVKDVETRAKFNLVSHGISKYYKKFLAVDQNSFTVSGGECFGLLGVNGAGKTTTFKMLMGDEAVSSGEAYVAGHSVKTQITKVYENIGYCPQFDAVFEELTGRENLTFFFMLRGQTKNTIAPVIEIFAQVLGFRQHLDKKVNQYSGGNKRKLSTAVALLGETKLLFVDEPTTGVDPAARRQMWKAVQAAQKAGRGVVLTSHSMEECEALCTRLTIMVNGQFRCIGAPQHLKNKFSQGFTLVAKITSDENSTVMAERTEAVKEYIILNFNSPKLMEEYQGLLTYYVSDTKLAWSFMFGTMEYAKTKLHVEDYSIAQTTLEQIFLQFTKYQTEKPAAKTKDKTKTKKAKKTKAKGKDKAKSKD